MKHRAFLQQLAHADIVAAIRRAEQKTSGEIRVFISRKAVDDPVAAGQAQFDRLGMRQTSHRNGVLIFVAPTARKFAILGDTGVHEKCGDTLWSDVAANMSRGMASGDFTASILGAVSAVGEALARHFPHRPDDDDQLSNAVGQD